MTLSYSVSESLRELQATIGKGNDEKGFHDRGKRLQATKSLYDAAGDVFPKSEAAEADARLTDYWTARAGLIVSEVSEAIEELRSGRAVTEVHYPTALEPAEGEEHSTEGHKPEGFPVELADAAIRIFDLAHEAGFDLAAVIEEKLAYNATRPRMHGRAF